jgi:hypothetical protein
MIEVRAGLAGSAGVEPAGWPPGRLTAADRERFARYAEALAFYRGEQWLGRPRRGETRLTFNYARALVRKVAAYIFPTPATFTVPSPEGARSDGEVANRAERALAETIAELDLGRLDVELCVDGSVLGDAAIKVTWDGATNRPVVVPVDSGTLVAEWAPDNPRRVRRVTQVYALTGERVAALFGFEGGGSRRPEGTRGHGNEDGSTIVTRDPSPAIRHLVAGRAYPVVETWTPERWRVEVAGQVVRDGANPYGWIPYVIAPNNPRPHEFWGESDLADLYDLRRELSARLSVLSRVLEGSGSPIAVLENVDGSEGISVGPGAKWELPEGASAYMLDLLGGGVGLHVQYVDVPSAGTYLAKMPALPLFW